MSAKNNALIAVALAGLIGSGIAAAADAPSSVKCYGVAKAGHNDCAHKSGIHACAGQAKVAKDKGDFVKTTADKCTEMEGTAEPMMMK